MKQCRFCQETNLDSEPCLEENERGRRKVPAVIVRCHDCHAEWIEVSNVVRILAEPVLDPCQRHELITRIGAPFGSFS